jgi:hypothetical protein
MRRWAWCIGFVLFLVAWVTASGFLERGYVPPPDVRTYDSFVKYFGQPEHVERIGNDHIVATLHLPPWHLAITLPSSMPEYVFDRSGALVDWSIDPGDNPRFQERWPKEGRATVAY